MTLRRLGLAIAVLLVSSAAWAEGFPVIDGADLQKGGLWELFALSLSVNVFLFWRMVLKDGKIEALNEKRVELSGRVEGALASGKAAMEAFAKTIEAMDEASDDRFETIKAVQVQLVTTAQLVGGNGETLKRIENDLIKELIGRGNRS